MEWRSFGKAAFLEQHVIELLFDGAQLHLGCSVAKQDLQP
jgi:hypothetical protein